MPKKSTSFLDVSSYTDLIMSRFFSSSETVASIPLSFVLISLKLSENSLMLIEAGSIDFSNL